jgi:hypothetical protein
MRSFTGESQRVPTALNYSPQCTFPYSSFTAASPRMCGRRRFFAAQEQLATTTTVENMSFGAGQVKFGALISLKPREPIAYLVSALGHFGPVGLGGQRNLPGRTPPRSTALNAILRWGYEMCSGPKKAKQKQKLARSPAYIKVIWLFLRGNAWAATGEALGRCLGRRV